MFWDNLTKTGRVNELKLSLSIYFKDGFSQGIKNSLAMQSVGLGMMKAKRLNPMEILGGHGIKDKSGFSAMLKKARELEDARRKLA
jgi:quinone-modifying oxidoreductase, subunit QmoC